MAPKNNENALVVLTDAENVECGGEETILLPGTIIQRVQGCETLYEVKSGPYEGHKVKIQRAYTSNRKNWI